MPNNREIIKKGNLDTKSILESKIEGEKQICYIKIGLVAFLSVMIVFAALGFARSDFIIILSEAIAAGIAMMSAIILLIYFKKTGKYPRYLGYVIATLDMIMVTLPFFAASYGYPVVVMFTSLPWVYVIFIFLSARRFSLRISLYSGILGFILYLSIAIPISQPLFPPNYTYPDGTYEKDSTGRIKLLSEDGEEFYVGFSQLDPIIKGVVILFSGVIAGMVGSSMRKKIESGLIMAEKQKELKERLKSSISKTVNSSKKTSETISSSFSEISASTNEMISTLKSISENAKEQLDAVKKNVNTVNNIIYSIESIDKSIEEQMNFTQNVSIKSSNITEGIKNIFKLTSTTDEDIKKLVQLTNNGRKAVEENRKAIQRIAKSSKEIMNINKEINEISDNTNVLSINAGIEAANTGEAGSGFTIIASQVRNLAYQTSEATKKINTSIEGILQRIDEGIEYTKKAEIIFDDIIKNMESSKNQMSEISNTTEKQYSAKKELDEYMEQIVNKMHEILDKVLQEKENSHMVLDEIEKIKNLATNTSTAIRQQTTAGEDILESTAQMSEIIEENKELSSEMKNILDEEERNEN